MMKIMLPSTMLILFPKKLELHLLLMSTLMMPLLLTMMNNKMMLFNKFLMMDKLSIIMMLLTLMSSSLILLSSNKIKEIIITMTLISLILMTTFSMNHILFFYITFELVLIPTLILITKYGKQPERLQAGIYLLMYTILASLPLLISIIMMKNNLSFSMMFISTLKYKFIMFMMMAFLVKMPMFFFHLWLPKAHVEAPLEGSMILAAVLLKLGGYGLLRIFPLSLNKINQMNYWMVSISLLGATMTSLNCIRQKDLKSLIAYSSVAHMGFILASMFTLNKMSTMGVIMMMIAHGFSSSALFMLVDDLYTKMHSRNIMLFKGLMLISPNITLLWFLFMSINISAPPSINTISEIIMMSSLLIWEKNTMIPMMMMSLATASFSMMLFINITHNKTETSHFKFSKQKFFLTSFSHLMLLIIMILKMEMLN